MIARFLTPTVLLAVVAAAAATTWNQRVPGPPPVQKGQLLLDGVLLEPPYLIQFDGDRLTVNDLELAKVTVTDQEPPLKLSTDTVDGAIQQAFAIHDSIEPLAGKGPAINATLAMLNANPLVESSISKGDDSIEVQFKGSPYPERLLFGVSMNPDRSASAQQQFLHERAQMMAYFLGENRLVVLHNGVLVATEPGTASTHAKSLRAAATTSLSSKARQKAISQIIPDAWVARSVADSMTARMEVKP